MSEEARRSQPTSVPLAPPLLIVLSGPSGVGKDVVLARLRESSLPLFFVTTLTTRPRRPTETDLVDYRFVSDEGYRKLRDAGELLESAQVYGNWYGVPRRPVEQALCRGQDAIIKIDVQGAATIKRAAPEAVSIFLVAPTMDELAARLAKRLTESPADLELRLRTAEAEMTRLSEFDYVVVNEQVDRAVAAIEAIISAEKCRVTPRRVSLS